MYEVKICLVHTQEYFMKISSPTGAPLYLDQTLVPGHGKFANHKCLPNALFAVTCSGVYIFARERINTHEEITCHYRVQVDIDDQDGDDEGKTEKLPCNCGSGRAYCDGFY